MAVIACTCYVMSLSGCSDMLNNASEVVRNVCDRSICRKKNNGIVNILKSLRKLIALPSFSIHQQHAWPLKEFKLFVACPYSIASPIPAFVTTETLFVSEMSLNMYAYTA